MTKKILTARDSVTEFIKKKNQKFAKEQNIANCIAILNSLELPQENETTESYLLRIKPVQIED